MKAHRLPGRRRWAPSSTSSRFPADMRDEAEKYREKLIEAVAETDDDAAREVPRTAGRSRPTEIKAALRRATIAGHVQPGPLRHGLQEQGRPAAARRGRRLPARRPLDVPPIEGHDDVGARARAPRADRRRAVLGPGLQDHDRPVRRPARLLPRLLRPPRRRLRRSTTRPRTRSERIGRLLKMHANKREEIKEVYAGDIAAAVGLKNVTTGDTICDEDAPGRPRGDEVPGAGHLGRHRAEDQGRPGEAGHGARQADAGGPDLPGAHRPGDRPDDHPRHGRAAPRDHRRPAGARVQRRRQRRQAPGRLPRDDHARRPRARAGSSARPAAAASTATCKIRIEPAEPRHTTSCSTTRSSAASIPQGVHQADRAGHPGGDGDRRPRRLPDRSASHVELYDGSYHEVDSSEMAFKIAGSMAFQDAAKKAQPVLLEPIMEVEVVVPEEYMGDVIGDLNSRRGHIKTWSRAAGVQVITARVPLSEMFGYSTDLRSMTQGRGNYTMQFAPYDEVPKPSAKRSSPRSGASQSNVEGEDRDGQGEVRSQQAAREHWDDRARGPREDDVDGGDHEGVGEEGFGDGQGVRPDRQGAGGEGAGDHDQHGARGVFDGEASLRARGLSGARGLREEHDHGCGADGRGDPGGVGGGRADAADAGAHFAGASGGGAVHRGVHEQGGHGGRPGASGPGGAGGAGAADVVRVSRGRRCRW